MNLPQDIYLTLEQVSWLSTVGHGHESGPEFDFPVTFVQRREIAVMTFNSDHWADAKTEAQGDLTGYLTKHHSDSYGGQWNNLAKQSRVLLEKAVGTKLVTALNGNGLPSAMLQPILVDLNRALLEITYRSEFPKVPVFFERLLRIYEVGRLPCGWTEEIENWPHGNLIAF